MIRPRRVGRTEGYAPVPVSFYGFYVDGFYGGKPAAKPMKFDFIGDSDTAGYCADPSRGDGFANTTDGYATWDQQLSRIFQSRKYGRVRHLAELV